MNHNLKNILDRLKPQKLSAVQCRQLLTISASITGLTVDSITFDFEDIIGLRLVGSIFVSLGHSSQDL